MSPQLERNKKNLIIGGGAVLLALLVAGFYFLSPRHEVAPEPPLTVYQDTLPEGDIFATCRICGYKSIGPDTLLCPICFVELTEAERITWQYKDMEEMVRQEQANFFADNGYRNSNLFYEPPHWEAEGVTYRKDTAWRPVVTKDYVERTRDTLIREGIIEQ